MLEQKTGRKLIIKRVNSDFCQMLLDHNYLTFKTEGFLLGVSFALKNRLEHDPIDTPRNASGDGEDVIIEDITSMNQISDLITLINAIYPEKYDNIENLKSMNRLLSVMADAGLDYLRAVCIEEEKIIYSKFISYMN